MKKIQNSFGLLAISDSGGEQISLERAPQTFVPSNASRSSRRRKQDKAKSQGNLSQPQYMCQNGLVSHLLDRVNKQEISKIPRPTTSVPDPSDLIRLQQVASHPAESVDAVATLSFPSIEDICNLSQPLVESRGLQNRAGPMFSSTDAPRVTPSLTENETLARNSSETSVEIKYQVDCVDSKGRTRLLRRLLAKDIVEHPRIKDWKENIYPSAELRISPPRSACSDTVVNLEVTLLSIMKRLKNVELALAELKTEHIQLKTAYSKLHAGHTQLKTAYFKFHTDHTQLKTAHFKLHTDYTQLKTDHARLKIDHVRLKTDHARLKTDHAQLKASHADSILQNHNDLRRLIEDIEQRERIFRDDRLKDHERWEARIEKQIRNQVSREMELERTVSACILQRNIDDFALQRIAELMGDDVPQAPYGKYIDTFLRKFVVVGISSEDIRGLGSSAARMAAKRVAHFKVKGEATKSMLPRLYQYLETYGNSGEKERYQNYCEFAVGKLRVIPRKT